MTIPLQSVLWNHLNSRRNRVKSGTTCGALLVKYMKIHQTSNFCSSTLT